MSYFDWYGLVEESDDTNQHPLSVKHCKDIEDHGHGKDHYFFDSYWCIDNDKNEL